MNDDCVKCVLRNDQVIKSDDIPLMTQYIPDRLVRLIGELPCCLFERKIEPLNGFTAYFDIVGFTSIVGNHVNSGKDIGILSDIFRTYYSIIIDTIKIMGGSVFQFAGDSILVSFERLYGETERDNWKRTLSAMYLARMRSNAYNQENSGFNGFVLDSKTGIGEGSFYQILLGDRTRFITPIIAGDAIDEAIASERECNGREIVIGKNAYKRACEAGMGDCFFLKNNAYVLEELPEGFCESVEKPGFCNESKLFENPRYYNRINAFINPLIQRQITTQFQGFVGDYREITCVMVRFEGQFTSTCDEFNLVEGYNNLNTVYELMQDKTIRFGGFSTKPDLSDKGTVFPVLFGAPTALENKERNAILFINELLKLKDEFPFISAVSIGVATGDVYCGEFGGITRKDYTVVGSTINFAARLMMMPEKNAAFMDGATLKKTETLCEVDPSKGIFLKGFKKEQSVFRYLGLRAEKKKEKKRIGMIGREDELLQIQTLFEESLKGAVTFCPVIGDAGMGKSYLVENFISLVEKEQRDVEILSGSCYQYEETTLFFPWRMLVKSIIGLIDGMTKDERKEKVDTIFQARFSHSDLVWVSFFLNMLGYDYEENEALKEIDVSIKQERFFSFVYKLILLKAREKPLILIIEDIHWSDAVSLKMLEYILNGAEEAPLLVVPVSRESDAISGFFRKYSVTVIYLKQLKEIAARHLATLLLNLDKEEEELVDKIVSTSDCNPFFIENIVQNMIESGVLVEDMNGNYFLSKDIKSINIPSSIQNIILSRLNSLLFEEQVVFKTASVIGRTFLSDILRTLVPEGITEYIFLNALQNFETHNLILREDEKRSAYYFKHITIRDVVYNTILESTRKELNMMLLSYLENRYSETLNSVVERLEYHASEAEAFPQVYKYALLSAVKSEKQFSNLDAIVHYLNALNALNKINLENKDEKVNEINLSLAAAYRKSGNYEQALEIYNTILLNEKRLLFRAAVLQGLGQCFQEQGKFDDAVSSLEDALALLGEKAPQSMLGTYMSILKEVFIQVSVHTLFRNKVKELEGLKRSFAEMRTDILNVLSKLYYFGQTEKVAWASISNFNNAFRIKSLSDKWCTAVATYAVALVSVGFNSLGLYYFSVANASAIQSHNRMANSIYKARYAYYFLFYNQSLKSIELLEEATNHFRSIGEMWELMTAVGALAQNYFLINDFEKSEKAYLETERVARKLNSPMHIGWTYNKVPFIRYLQGKIAAQEAIAMLTEGIAMSEAVHDHMTLCIHYGHLANIAVIENDVIGAIQYAKQILKENKLYSVNIPHVKISYVDAVEAFIFALKSGRTDFNKHEILSLANKALKKALSLGKTFYLIEGPARRASARLHLYKNDIGKASTECTASLENLKNSPYEREYATTLLLASACFPEKTDEYTINSELFFARNGIKRR